MLIVSTQWYTILYVIKKELRDLHEEERSTVDVPPIWKFAVLKFFATYARYCLPSTSPKRGCPKAVGDCESIMNFI